jgi:hypothetical protein
MKLLLYASAFAIVGSCSTLSHKEKIQSVKNGIKIEESDMIRAYAATITANELEKHLFTFASGAFEGRETGTAGQKLASNYLKNYYIYEDIFSPFADLNYFQTIPKSYIGDGYNDSENVLAYIEGSTKPEEIIVVSAHLDAEGVGSNGEIYYGADDDGSGTVALLEMAQAFRKAQVDGYGPKRSILFLHFTAEEIGLLGSRYYSENPVFPLENTIANLNIDMIGRVDRAHTENPDYVYLIGSDRHSTELHYISEAVNDAFYNLELDYKFNDEDEHNRFYYRSDHYNFGKYNIPVIFYFNGEHEDYHKPTDTPDKINYPLLEKRTRLIFATAWQLANQERTIVADKASK